MGATLVINTSGVETRVALVENGTISEYYHERKKDKGIVGNIYKGRVVRVLPGMQAAFVDVGLEKAAFLYVSDVFYDPFFSEQQFELTEGEHEEVEDTFPDEHEHEHEEPILEPTPEPEAQAAEPAPAKELEAVALKELAPSPIMLPLVPAAAAVAGEQPAPAKVEAAPEPSEAKQEIKALPATPPAVETVVPVATTSVTDPIHAESASVDAASKPSDSMSVPAAAPATEEVVGVLPIPGLAPAPESVGAPAANAVVAPETAPAAEAAPKPEGEEKSAAPVETERGEFRARDRRRRRRGGMARREVRDREEREENSNSNRERDIKPRKMANIQDLLKVGQEIIVQVAKDPIGTKGARVTSHISLPGRHLVFMPTVDHVGISRRIERESERRRLREIVDRLRPSGTGFIVRTVAENISTEKLEADAKFLIGIWNTVGAKKEKQGAPVLLHPDLDLALRATRDLFAQDVEKLVIDDHVEWERVSKFVEAQDPALKGRVVLHESEEPIFDAYGIEHELQKAQQRKVWLRSGGYLIIDQAEALTAIDVNSGRYVGKKSLEETITKINTEAAREIVYQLRLRNIGGIMIIDFIDMDKAQNREKVFKALQDALGRDKAKTNVLKISELGLVEMTRKRVRESLGRTLNEPCGYCDGRGYLKSKRTVAYEVFREIRREAANYKESVLVVNCHPDVARILQVDERDELRYLMDRYNKSIHVRSQQNYHQEQYDIYGKVERSGKRERDDNEREHADKPRPAATEPLAVEAEGENKRPSAEE